MIIKITVDDGIAIEPREILSMAYSSVKLERKVCMGLDENENFPLACCKITHISKAGNIFIHVSKAGE